MGINGTNGVLNGLILSGSFLLMMITPTQTRINANNVPILVKLPATSPGMNPAKPPTKTNKMIFDLYGVLNLGCNSENAFGNKPSVLMV